MWRPASSSASVSAFRVEETRGRRAVGTWVRPQHVCAQPGHKPGIWLESQLGTCLLWVLRQNWPLLSGDHLFMHTWYGWGVLLGYGLGI